MGEEARAPVAERPDVMEVLDRFRRAWAAGDRAAMRELCVTDPSMVVFDVDGHGYRSARHWARRPTTADPAPDVPPEGTVHRDTAWVTYESAESGRTTLIAVAGADGWRIAHVHRSRSTPGPRPGDI